MNYINKIINNDCLEILKEIPDESVDLCIIDPPYNMDYHGRGKINTFTEIKNDKMSAEDHSIWFKKVIEELYIKSKNDTAIYVFVDFRNYPRFHSIIKEYYDIKNCIVWDKCSIGMGQSYRFQHEFIIYAVKGKPVLNFIKKNISDVWRAKRDPISEYVHPTQKPIDLMARMIQYSSKEGDVVLDCFAGSGATLVASKRNKRNFIGVEIEEKYCKIIKERLNSIQETLL